MTRLGIFHVPGLASGGPARPGLPRGGRRWQARGERPAAAVRREAVRSVGLAGGGAGRDLLARAARDPALDRATRRAAIHELARSFGEDALDAMALLLADRDGGVRESAVQALALVPGDGALALLGAAAASDASPVVRREAARAVAGRRTARGR